MAACARVQSLARAGVNGPSSARGSSRPAAAPLGAGAALRGVAVVAARPAARPVEARGVEVIVAGRRRSRPEAEELSDFLTSEGDTGSTKYQVAMMTKRVAALTAHLKVHKKDFATRRGLTQILGKRQRLLKYLLKTDPVGYYEILQTLEVRDKLTAAQ